MADIGRMIFRYNNVIGKGNKGNDGVSPHIGGNGNWFVGAIDTGIKAQGEQGVKGNDGKTWYITAAAPSNALGAVGDMHLNTASYDIREKTGASAWTVRGNLKGGKGDAGNSPFVGANGNWWVGATDTGIKPKGDKGEATVITIGGNGNWFLDGVDTGTKAQGIQGAQGTTPNIGGNGNWFVGATDTGIKAQGEQGVKGDSPHIGGNGNWFVGAIDTGIKAQGAQGERGESFKVDAQGTLAGRAAYNTEGKGFSYLDVPNGNLYFKNSNTSGDWSAPIPFGKGDTPEIGVNDNWWIGGVDTGKKAIGSDANVTKTNVEAALGFTPARDEVFDTDKKGLVPARIGAVVTKYLREDGTWVTPTNTTYTLMTQAELNAGTVTTGRTINALILKTWGDLNYQKQEAGKGLSQEDYTTGDKNKLAGLESSKFKGQFTSIAQMNSQAERVVGAYAYVDAGVGSVVAKYIYDSSDDVWVLSQGESIEETPASIKSKYESNLDTNAFTDANKTLLANFAVNVRATVLTGISFAVSTAVVAGDTILAALGKLQKQINDLSTNKADLGTAGGQVRTNTQNDARFLQSYTETGRYKAITNVAANKTVAIIDENSYWTLSGTRTVTVPTNAAVAFPIGGRVDIQIADGGKATFTPSGGVTLTHKDGTGSIVIDGFIVVSLLKTGTNTWTIIGG